jgi:hypothetical protein
MRDLLDKRNELCKLSQNLRVVKFDSFLAKEDISHLIEVQDQVYKRWKFYDNFIKNRRIVKNERKEICTKER